MRGKALIKFLKALDLLSHTEGITINRIGEELDIDRRSVYRLIRLIEDLGFPIYDEKVQLEKEKRWRLDERFLKKLPNMKMPDVNLSLTEILSLYLLKGLKGPLRGTEIESNIDSAFDKLSLFLPDNTFSQISKIKALFISQTKLEKDYSGKEETIDRLREAMLDSEICYVKYHSFFDDKVKNFKIDPLHFFENDGGLYILVNATTFGDIRTLAVERIQEIEKSGEHFEYPVNFDPAELIASAFDIVYGDPIDVKIWFSAGQARYIKERTWSKTQRIDEQDDGSICLSMTTSGRWDVVKWVLTYGDEAKIIEPEDLKMEVVEVLKSTLAKYE